MVMRTLVFTAFCAFALLLASCTDSPTATTTVKLGKTTVEAIQTSAAYKGWYEAGYETYPSSAGLQTFDSSVQVIKAAFDPAVHKMVMVVKPNCGCQTTQIWMPRVMKALDAAGIPHDNVDVWVTDSHLSGIDDIKGKYNVRVAPVFIVVKNDAVMSAIDPTSPYDLPTDKSIEQVLAGAFAKP